MDNGRETHIKYINQETQSDYKEHRDQKDSVVLWTQWCEEEYCARIGIQVIDVLS